MEYSQCQVLKLAILLGGVWAARNLIMEETEEISIAEEKVVDISLKDLAKKLEEFAKARDWEKYHIPRNLLLAMVGEVGELSEIFQWKGEVDKGLPNWEESDKEHLAEELSDVLLYLIRLSDICGIDLGDAATKKIVKNTIKYPPKAG
ncbi:dCTP pyrophosphatase 1-like [Populus alba x Populus x berolinensis]|nr:dCTP pyrophosphatase 1-like [Populus alba x Populus x berolinensis]KAJ6981499.1 dCTP pyrophosphatase 1-like [Populus alba x Populus x berolinensis]